MSEVTIEYDDVQEFIFQKVTDGEGEKEQFAQAIFDDGVWRLYQQWKSSEQDPQVQPPEPETDEE